MADRVAVAQRSRVLADDMEQHFSAPGASLWMPPPKTNDSLRHTKEDEAWPAVPSLVRPLGSRVLVQLRQPIARTQGGTILPDEVRATDADNMTVAKVIAVGSLAYRNRETQEEWPEGAWCKPGDYIRIPKYQQDSFTRPFQRPEAHEDEKTGKLTTVYVGDKVTFAMVRDLDVSAIYDTLEAALSEQAFI